MIFSYILVLLFCRFCNLWYNLIKNILLKKKKRVAHSNHLQPCWTNICTKEIKLCSQSVDRAQNSKLSRVNLGYTECQQVCCPPLEMSQAMTITTVSDCVYVRWSVCHYDTAQPTSYQSLPQCTLMHGTPCGSLQCQSFRPNHICGGFNMVP